LNPHVPDVDRHSVAVSISRFTTLLKSKVISVNIIQYLFNITTQSGCA